MDLNEYRSTLYGYTATPEFAAMEPSKQQETLDGIRRGYLEENPDSNPDDVNSITQSINVEYLRNSGQGRAVPDEFLKRNNIIFPHQEEGFSSLSKDDRLKKVEEFRNNIPAIAAQNPTQKEDTEFFLNQSADEIQRRVSGEGKGRIRSDANLLASGFLSTLAEGFGMEGAAKSARQYFADNPEYEDEFHAKLSQGLGSGFACMAVVAGLTAVTGGAGAPAAVTEGVAMAGIFSTNAIMRYNEAYRNAINTGLDEDTAAKAGVASLPGAVIDSIGDRILTSRLLPELNMVLKTGTAAQKRVAIEGVLANKSSRAVLFDYAKDSIGSGLSEVAGDYVAAVGPYMATGDDSNLPTSKQNWDSFLVGAAVGGVLIGVPTANQFIGDKSGRKIEGQETPKYSTKDARNIGESARMIDEMGKSDFGDPKRIYDLIADGRYSEAFKLSSSMLDARDAVLNAQQSPQQNQNNGNQEETDDEGQAEGQMLEPTQPLSLHEGEPHENVPAVKKAAPAILEKVEDGEYTVKDKEGNEFPAVKRDGKLFADFGKGETEVDLKDFVPHKAQSKPGKPKEVVEAKYELHPNHVEKPKSFETSQGSVYTLNSDGSTTRDKQSPETDTDKGNGPQEPVKTLYTNKEVAESLKTGTMDMESVPEDAITTKPEVGLHPVETKEDGTIRVGDEITKIISEKVPVKKNNINEAPQRQSEDYVPHNLTEPAKNDVEAHNAGNEMLLGEHMPDNSIHAAVSPSGEKGFVARNGNKLTGEFPSGRVDLNPKDLVPRLDSKGKVVEPYKLEKGPENFSNARMESIARKREAANRVKGTNPELEAQLEEERANRKENRLPTQEERDALKEVKVENVIGKSFNSAKSKPIGERILKDIKTKNPSLKIKIVKTMKANGFYDPKSNTIFLRSDVATSQRVIKHEVAHAITTQDLVKHVDSRGGTHLEALNAALSDPATPAYIKDLIKAYLHAAKVTGNESQIDADFSANNMDVLSGLLKDNKYGYINIHEFVAEAMSNSDFQEHLSKILYKGKTVWDHFAEIISRINTWLGTGDMAKIALLSDVGNRNVLTRVLASVERIVNEGEQNGDNNTEERLLPVYRNAFSEDEQLVAPTREHIKKTGGNARSLFGSFFSSKYQEGAMAGKSAKQSVDVSNLRFFDEDAYGSGPWNRFSSVGKESRKEQIMSSVEEYRKLLVGKGYDGIRVTEPGFGETFVVFPESYYKVNTEKNNINSEERLLPEDDESTTEKGQMGFEKKRMLKLLGSSMYNKPVAQVAIKELLQNSFDAVKAMSNANAGKAPKIDIKVNYDTRTITVKDNGIGMTKDIVKKAFLTIGGTNKEGLNAGQSSGGLGLAKVQFLLSSERIKVESVRDGVKTIIDTTNEGLYNDDFEIRTEQTDQENGTEVSVTIPKTYETMEGETRDIDFPGEWSADIFRLDILSKPLIGDADITATTEQDDKIYSFPLPIGKNTPKGSNNFVVTSIYDDNEFNLKKGSIINQKDFGRYGISQGKYGGYSGKDGIDIKPITDLNLYSKITFDWGTADLYISEEKKASPKHQILSSGLYQFDSRITNSQYETVKYDVVIDIKPSVKAESEQYPFNNQREDFKNTVEQDIKELKNFVVQYASGEATKDLVDVFKSIKQLPKTNPEDNLTPEEREKIFADFDSIKSSDKEISKTERAIRNYTITRKSVFDSDTKEVVADRTDEKRFKSSFKANRDHDKSNMSVDSTGMDVDVPNYHNNTTFDYLSIDGADQFFSDFGSVVLDLVRDASKWQGFSGLKPSEDNKHFVGVSIDKSYGGVNVKNILNAIFINPLAFDVASSEEAVGVALHIALHEITHERVREEGAGFTSQLANVYKNIYGSKKYGYYEGMFRSVYSRHFDTFKLLKQQYDKSTTRNISKSFEGNKIEGSDPGSVQGNGETLQDGESTTGGSAGNPENNSGDKIGDVIVSNITRQKNNINSQERLLPATAEESAEYERAHNEGDSETANAIERQVAERNGWKPDNFHGTIKGNFNEFDTTKHGYNFGEGSYFTPEIKRAENYAGAGYQDGERIEGPEGSKVYKTYLKYNKPYNVSSDAEISDIGYNLHKSNRSEYDRLAQKIADRRGRDSIVGTGTTEVGNEWIREQGYDAIVKSWKPNEPLEIVVFNPSQIKEMGPTRDFYGKLIPLSERFSESKDIRYLPEDYPAPDPDRPKQQTRNQYLRNAYKRYDAVFAGNLNDKNDTKTWAALGIIRSIRRSDIARLEPEIQDMLFACTDNIYNSRKNAIDNPETRLDTTGLIDTLKVLKEAIDSDAVDRIMSDYGNLVDFDAIPNLDITDREAMEKAVNKYISDNKLDDVVKAARQGAAKTRMDRMIQRWRDNFTTNVKIALDRFGDADNYIKELEAMYGADLLEAPELRELVKAHFNYITSADVSAKTGVDLYTHNYAINNIIDGTFAGFHHTIKEIANMRNAQEKVTELSGKFRDPMASKNKLLQALDGYNRYAELHQVSLKRLSLFDNVRKWLQESLLGGLYHGIMHTAVNRYTKYIKTYTDYRMNVFEKNLGREINSEDRMIISIAGRLVQFEAGSNPDLALLTNIEKERKSIRNIIANSHNLDMKKFNKIKIEPIFEQMVEGLEGLEDTTNLMKDFITNLADHMKGSEDSNVGNERLKLLQQQQNLFAKFSLESRIISEGLFKEPFKEQVHYQSNNVFSEMSEFLNTNIELDSRIPDSDQVNRQQLKSKSGRYEDRQGGLTDKGFYSYNNEYILERNIKEMSIDSAALPEQFILAKRLEKGSQLNNIISEDEDGYDHQVRVDEIKGMAVKLIQNAKSKGSPQDFFTRLLSKMTSIYARPVLSGIHQPASQLTSAFADYSIRTGNTAGWLKAAAFYASNSDRINEWFAQHQSWTAGREAIEAMGIDTRRTLLDDENSSISNHPAVKGAGKAYDGLGRLLTYGLRHADAMSAKVTILAEYSRMLQEKGYADYSLDTNIRLGSIEGKILSQATLNAEMYINTSNKILRGDLFTDRNKSVSVMRNLLFAFAAHQASLASQMAIAIRDITSLLKMGAPQSEIASKYRTMAAIVAQQAVFTTSRFIVGMGVASAVVSLVKSLNDDKDEKLDELAQKLEFEKKRKDPVRIARAEAELAEAKNVLAVITKLKNNTQSEGSWFKQVIRDGTGSFHLAFNSGVMQKLVFFIPDKWMGQSAKEANDVIVQNYEQRIQEARKRNNIKEIGRLTEEMEVIKATEYIPMAYPSNDSLGLSGLYGAAADNFKLVASRANDAAMGIRPYTFADFVLSASSVGIGQSDINKAMRSIDKIEVANWKVKKDLEEKKIPEAEKMRRDRSSRKFLPKQIKPPSVPTF